MGKTTDASTVTDHLFYSITEHDPDILDRVMAVHVEVTFCRAGEIESPVACHCRKHVVKEWYPAVHG